MPKVLNTNNYSLTTKVVLSFIIAIFVFLFIKYALAIPTIKEESYKKEIANIDKNLVFVKEQMNMAIESIRAYTHQQIRLNKERIVSEIKDLRVQSAHLTNQELKKRVQNSNISDFCSYQLFFEERTEDHIKDLNIFKHNNKSILNQWKKYELTNRNQIVRKKNMYLFYNAQLSSKRLLSISCQINLLNTKTKGFETKLKSHLKTSLSIFKNDNDMKTLVLWINSNLANDDSRPLFEENIENRSKRYIITALSNVQKLTTGQLSVKQILDAANKKPLEYKLDGEDVFTWIIKLDSSNQKNIHLLIHTVKKETLLSKTNTNLFVLLNETLIAIVISFILLAYLLRSLFKNIQEKTKELKKSLDEKEVLLKEIHHRVKNNLAQTITLIELQEDSVFDANTKSSLVDIKERIYTMELLHRKLYESSNLNEIPLKSYIEDLVSSIVKAYSINNNLSINYRIEELDMNIETALPIGLIVNELITNSLKYAFRNNNNPILEIRISKVNTEIIMSIQDNGPGLKLNINKSKTLGLKLVNTIVKLQLQGSYDYLNENGAKFIIRGKVRK